MTACNPYGAVKRRPSPGRKTLYIKGYSAPQSKVMKVFQHREFRGLAIDRSRWPSRNGKVLLAQKPETLSVQGFQQLALRLLSVNQPLYSSSAHQVT